MDRSIVKGPVYFLDLRLKDIDGKQLASNFYWLPVQQDVLDYAHSRWFVTPIKRFADLTALNQLPQANVNLKIIGSGFPGKRTIQLENISSHMAFLLYLELRNEQGEPILPVYWDDNYITLVPNEKRSISVTFPVIKGKVLLNVNGWNIQTIRQPLD
ncbi:MAG: hypothetical protein J7L94_00650 [Caldisericaceae bacterium]|nr:hypothetical protein [Caldisericaceae bacterium]